MAEIISRAKFQKQVGYALFLKNDLYITLTKS